MLQLQIEIDGRRILPGGCMLQSRSLAILLAILLAIFLVFVYPWAKEDQLLSQILSNVIAGLILALLGIIARRAWLLFQNNPSANTSASSGFLKNKDFQKQYLTLLGYQNRDFDIKGLSTQTIHTLELEQVFVELKFQPQAAHKATANLLNNVSGKKRSDSYPIWQFFAMLSENEKSQNAKIVIVGPPGGGKTTLLKHITLLLAGPSKNEEYKKLKFKKMPVLLFLRDHVSDVIDHPNILLPEVVESTITKWDVAVPTGWFNKKMKSGECLIMLDGLDEVAEPPVRRRIVTWLEKQIRAYPNNTFIITSRPHGYRENPITGVSVLEVMPFNRSQIDSFVQSWYLANEIKSHSADDMGVRMAAKSGADDLLRRLEKTPTLMELAVNPLLLTMIATVHRYRSALPGRRVELYKEICEVFLGKRQESKGLTIDLIPVQKQTVLQSLAYEMMCKNIREIKVSDALEMIRTPLSLVKSDLNPEDFLKNVEQQSGLLLERENGIYGFAHKTFQEYLASMLILEQKKESELYARINDDWWHEVIKLYSAQTDATDIITACLDQDPPSALALSLAIQCLEEARQVQPQLRAITEKNPAR
jgi:predicted NACHT family NTPase